MEGCAWGQVLRGRATTIAVVRRAIHRGSLRTRAKRDVINQKTVKELGRKLSVTYDQYGFISAAHPKLRPVETTTAGVFVAGACMSPSDIPDSIAQASAAASKVLSLFSGDELETNSHCLEQRRQQTALR